MPRGVKKAAMPGAEVEAPKSSKPVQTPGVPEIPEAPFKRPEPAAPVMVGRGTVVNDYEEAMAKIRSGELSVPVLTSKGWIVDKPEA